MDDSLGKTRHDCLTNLNNNIIFDKFTTDFIKYHILHRINVLKHFTKLTENTCADSFLKTRPQA